MNAKEGLANTYLKSSIYTYIWRNSYILQITLGILVLR